jgi:hypothetical protein
MRRFALLPLALISFGCSPVYSTQPVGEKPRSLAAEKEAWEGTWIGEAGAFTIVVTDAERGKLKVGWIDQKKDGLKVHALDVELRAFAKWTFASFRDPDDKSGQQRYVFLRVAKKERQLVLYHPDAKAWQSLVERKRLAGTVKQRKSADGKITPTEITIGALKAKELGFITAGERAAALFSWEDPVVLIKLTK